MKLNVLILSILILCAIIHGAATQNETSLQNASGQNESWIQGMIETAIINAINSEVLGGFNEGLKLMNFLLAYHTPPELADLLSSVHIEIIKMLAPLYLLVLSWNAIEIMTSEVIANQAKARITIQNSVISMVLVASSLQIYKWLLLLSQGISGYLVSIGFDSKLTNTITAEFIAANIGAFALPAILLVLILAIMIILFLLLRVYIVALGVLIFPIGIFMYFFSPLKKYGKLMLSLIFYFIFIQIILALFVFVMNALIAAPPESLGIPQLDISIMELRVLLYLGGLFLILIIPMTILLQVILLVAFPEVMVPIYAASFAGTAAGSTGTVMSKLNVSE